jgi:hypothetical protein
VNFEEFPFAPVADQTFPTRSISKTHSSNGAEFSNLTLQASHHQTQSQ